MPAIGIRRSRAAAVVVGIAMTATVALAAAPFARHAHAATFSVTLSKFDSRLVTDINRARAAHGLRSLVVVAGTTDVAHRWSCHMANHRTLSHNLSLDNDLEAAGSKLWTTDAENVGYVRTTSTADRLFKAYMNSPEHRANILDPSFRYIGVFSKKGGHKRWNTIDFVGSRSTSYNFDYGTTRATC